MEGTYDDGRASTAPSARAILRAGADGAVDARQERASVYLWTGARWRPKAPTDTDPDAARSVSTCFVGLAIPPARKLQNIMGKTTEHRLRL